MSIRLLTAKLQAETAETRRRQRFQAIRSEHNAQPAPRATPKRQPATQPAPAAQPAPRAPRQVGLRERTTHNPWGVPGGIAARFGKNALQSSAPSEPEPVEEPASDLEVPAETAEETAQTQAPKSNDNPRITIELQSH